MTQTDETRAAVKELLKVLSVQGAFGLPLTLGDERLDQAAALIQKIAAGGNVVNTAPPVDMVLTPHIDPDEQP